MHTALNKARARRARDNGADHGFTLIELLVVVVIIGILIAIAIPVYLNYQKGAHNKAAESDLRNAIVAMEQCYSDDSKYPASKTIDGKSKATSADVCGTGAEARTVNVSDGTKLVITKVSDSEWKASSEAQSGDKTFYYMSKAGGAVSDTKPTGF